MAVKIHYAGAISFDVQDDAATVVGLVHTAINNGGGIVKFDTTRGGKVSLVVSPGIALAIEEQDPIPTQVIKAATAPAAEPNINDVAF